MSVYDEMRLQKAVDRKCNVFCAPFFPVELLQYSMKIKRGRLGDSFSFLPKQWSLGFELHHQPWVQAA